MMEVHQMALDYVALGASLALGLLVFVLSLVYLTNRPVPCLLQRFLRLPLTAQFVVLFFTLQFIVYGSTKSDMSEGQGAPVRVSKNVRALWTVPESATVTETDVRRGYRQVSTTGGVRIDYAMPAWASPIGTWHLRGAEDDVTRVDFGDWRFPLGSNEIDHVWAFPSGCVRLQIRDTSRELGLAQVQVAVPEISRLWFGVSPEGHRVLTWENFVSPSGTLSSTQLEFRRSGDFILRNGDNETTYRRVSPSDWDGDGLVNLEDENPWTYDGDNFGPPNALPEGCNANAYCMVEVVATGADAHVVFIGDGASDYPDPDFMAKAGETNEVALLIGKAYQISSDQPIMVGNPSDVETELYATHARLWHVLRPIEVGVMTAPAYEADVSGMLGSTFEMYVRPSRVGGAFQWAETGCCPILGSGCRFTVGCTDTCLCAGCFAEGSLVYEGYAIPVTGGACGCFLDADGPRVTETEGPHAMSIEACFTKPVVIYEDRYEDSPGVWRSRNSTRTKLILTAHGGPTGGLLTIVATNLDKLTRLAGPELPVTYSIPAGNTVTFEQLYDAASESDEADDIVIACRISDEVNSAVSDATCSVTSLKLELCPVYEAPNNRCAKRHSWGIGEIVQFRQTPDSPVLDVAGNDVQIIGNGAYRNLIWGVGNVVHGLSFSSNGVQYRPDCKVEVPLSVEGINPTYISGGLPANVAGGVVLKQELRIAPLSVSFRRIQVEEVPCEEEIPPQGYFVYAPTNVFFRSHTREAGAGHWYAVDGNNIVGGVGGCDRAGYLGVVSRMTSEGNISSDTSVGWLAGELQWKIPFGWQSYSAAASAEPVATFSEDQLQVFRITATGDFSVEKLGHMVKRSIDGSVECR